MAPNRLAIAIMKSARELGIDPIDLATAISYETAGTFDKWKKGPTTRWGEHRGLIQMGEVQRKQYGVTEDMSESEQLGAVTAYLRDQGVRPGHGLLDLYAAINAGEVGRYDVSDEAQGGAPGTVCDKVDHQMDGHRRNALELLFGAKDDIKRWQAYLNSLGAKLPVDGDPGKATRDATKIFQKAMGLPVNGVPDLATRGTINEMSRHHSPFVYDALPIGPDVPSRLDFARATPAKGTPMAPNGMIRLRIPFDGPVPALSLPPPVVPIPRPRPDMPRQPGPADNLPSRIDFGRSDAPPSGAATGVSAPVLRRSDSQPLLPPVGEADRRALAQRAKRTIAGSAGASALSYPANESGLYGDPRTRSFFSSKQQQFPEQRFEGSPKPSPFLPSTINPLNYAPAPQRGRAHGAIDDLLAPLKSRPGVRPHASEAAAAAAAIDDEIDSIERRLRTDRRGYFRDEDMQERYRELLGIRARRR